MNQHEESWSISWRGRFSFESCSIL